MTPVGSVSGRSVWLALTVLVGLLWAPATMAQAHGDQALGLVQAGSRPAPPASGAAGSDRPHRPSYGRWSPGQVLPPSAGAIAITDYEQYHLRRPPRGYSWLQCDGDFILTNAAGLIFDVIPGGGR